MTKVFDAAEGMSSHITPCMDFAKNQCKNTTPAKAAGSFSMERSTMYVYLSNNQFQY